MENDPANSKMEIATVRLPVARGVGHAGKVIPPRSQLTKEARVVCGQNAAGESDRGKRRVEGKGDSVL